MNKQSIIVTFVVVAILGIGLGFLLNKGNITSPPNQANTSTESISIVTSPTTLPQPTFPPLSETVKRIDSDNIIVEGERGEMTIPKNPAMVKVLLRVGKSLVPGTFDDLEVGQKTTLKIIVPGKEAELIIEK